MKRPRLVGLMMLLTFVAGCGGSWSSGDRVLVGKYLYDSGLGEPHRFDVVVFRCPEPPGRGGPLDNFIKRLLGLAGETIAIFFGQLFVTTDWQPPGDLDARHEELDPARANPLDLWQAPYLYRDDANAKALFQANEFTPAQGKGTRRGKFEIVRKDPGTMLAMRRIVADNDFPAADLAQAAFPPRWVAGAGKSAWTVRKEKGFHHNGQATDLDWLRYQHVLRPADWPEGKDRPHRPQLITDFSGYNFVEKSGQPHDPGGNWVGDLMLDFELTVERPEGQLCLELARGVDRFRACWELDSGRCTLWRLGDNKEPTELKSAETSLKQAGTYHLRFANFDQRLTVWVDRELPFGDGVAYPRAWYFDGKDWVNTGPTANDLRPASVGSKGAAVEVQHLQLWRNTYYTIGGNAHTSVDATLPGPDKEQAESPAAYWEDFWSNPARWDPLRKLDFATYYVQKGHYLCLGDNSPESSDSRTWGLVPQRLMLGRALMVYYPFSRAGLIR